MKTMLVIAREVGEKVVIDGVVTVEILGLKSKKALIGITAPRDIPIARKEVYLRTLRVQVEPKSSIVQIGAAAQNPGCG